MKVLSQAHERLHHDQLPWTETLGPSCCSIDPEHPYTHVSDNWPTQNSWPTEPFSVKANLQRCALVTIPSNVQASIK